MLYNMMHVGERAHKRGVVGEAQVLQSAQLCQAEAGVRKSSSLQPI
jgi:hypothetical protein